MEVAPLDVDAAVVARRRARAAELDAVHAALESAAWIGRGQRSPTMWLSATSGESPGQCAVTIHLATAIQQMPIAKAAFADGTLAESALRLLADIWSPTVADAFARDEEMLVGWCRALGHRDLKVVLDRWRLCADPEQADGSPPDPMERRGVHLSQLLDGIARLDGTLTPEGYALVSEALRFLARKRGAEDTRRPDQRRHDALVEMAKIALADATDPAVARRSQPTVIASIAYDDLAAGVGGGVVDTGSSTTIVPTETIRRWCCDAGIHRLVYGPDGTTIDFGRRARTVSDSQWLQLIARDHGCRLCLDPSGPAGCDAHHAVHWLDGDQHGPTDLDNLALVCWWHHHLLHEQRWKLEPLGAGHFVLRDANGEQREVRPPWTGHAQMPLPLPAPAA